MKARLALLAIAAALLALATPANAVDMNGYFRDGYGTNNKGGGQACYKTPGMDYKLRLGNECDNYGEWLFNQSVYKDKNGVEFSAGFMFNYDQDTAVNPGTAVSSGFGIQQNYIKAKFPQLAGAQFWAGKQYYRRENIDMIDFFYLNLSDTGVGVEDVDTGFGKFSFSVFSAKTPGTWSVAYFRPDARLEGIPVNPGGTLEVDANVVAISRNKDVSPKPQDEASASVFLTVEHHQSGILGGNNTALVQYANGAAAGMGSGVPGFSTALSATTSTSPLDKNNYQFRVIDQLLLQPSAQFQILVGGIAQWKQYGDPSGNIKVTQYGLFTRPVYYINDYFKLQGDLGYTTSKTKGEDAVNLVKATFAPTLTPAPGEGGGFFVRPEIRLFVTYGAWNDATASAGGPSSQVDFGTDKSGVTFGTSVETWF